MVCLLIIGSVQRDDIGTCEQFIKRDVTKTKLGRKVSFLIRIICNDIHIEPTCETDHVGPDMARTDNTNRFPLQVKTTQSFLGKRTSRFDAAMRIADPSRERKKERHSKLLHRMLT